MCSGHPSSAADAVDKGGESKVIEILVYISDMQAPLRIVAQEIVEGAESGIDRYISFRNVNGREGMVLLNPEKVAAVVISPTDESA
jgi:hypothetical protein